MRSVQARIAFFKFIGKLALFGNRSQYNTTTLLEQSHSIQVIAYGAQLLLIQVTGHLSAISCQEGDGGTFVKQGRYFLDLGRSEAQSGCNKLEDLGISHDNIVFSAWFNQALNIQPRTNN